jgi:hypothetical protein
MKLTPHFRKIIMSDQEEMQELAVSIIEQTKERTFTYDDGLVRFTVNCFSHQNSREVVHTLRRDFERFEYMRQYKEKNFKRKR